MDRDEEIERLRTARVGHLATVTPDGRPHVVPFVFALVDEGDRIRLYWVVDDKPKRSARLRRLENIERGSAVEVVVDGYDDDWTRLWWVRASGVGRIVDEEVERAVGLEALAAKYEPYASASPLGPVVAIDVATIASWTAAPA